MTWRGSIIPALPDDLGLRCLALVSHGFHGVLETVSKSWRDALRSREYASLKDRLGSSGDWIFLLTDSAPTWIAYDPLSDTWHPLPSVPHSHPRCLHEGFSSVCAAGRLFLIGGTYSPPSPPLLYPPSHITDHVFRFDPFLKTWSRAASMLSPRSHFACSVVSGRVFVAGGRAPSPSSSRGISLAEVYDPLTDRWEELPTMPDPMADCVGMSYKGSFHVLSDQVGLFETIFLHVFDPKTKSWCTVEQVWPFSPAVQYGVQVMPDSRVYTIVDGGASLIKTRVSEEEQWVDLGAVPPAVIGGHPRPLESFGYGFTALRGKLYVMGGKVLRWQGEGAGWFNIVRLNLVRVCDPDIQPLKWEETRPLCGNAAGCVIGCASLEEGRSSS